MSGAGASWLARTDRERVLYVIHHHEISGAELCQVPVIEADADPLVACPPDSHAEAFLRERGIPTVPLPYRTLRHSGGRIEELRSVGRGLAAASDLRRILREHPEREIVYSVALRPALLGAVAALGLRRRQLWTLADFMPPVPLRQAARLLARRSAGRVVAPSRVIAADFAGRSAALARLVEVVHPGADTSRVPAAEPRPPHVAVIGQVSPTKRTDVAIDAAARVAASVREFRLDVIGRAQFREEEFAFERALQERVQGDPLLRERVRFRGHVPDAAGELGAYRVLLHCRTDEPYGMVVAEAMAAGAAVVAPRAAGPAEIVEDGVTGFLYEPGGAEEAARHLARLLADPALAAEMGAAGRERVIARFSTELQVQTVDRLLSELSRRG